MNPTDLLSGIRITDVWRALGGPDLKAAGPQRYRGTAWWRNGDSYAVSLNDACGVWHDFVAGHGGGILDLVIQVRSGTRHEALQWLAGVFGFPLDGTALSAAERISWARERRAVEHSLPAAEGWRRVALALAEELLSEYSRGMLDSMAPFHAEGTEQRTLTDFSRRIRTLSGVALVDELRFWQENIPELTSAMERVGRRMMRAHIRGLLRYMGAFGDGA